MEKIGTWAFDPRAATLSRGNEKKSLENRSALVLETLCRRRGEVVSKEELLAEVWQGRAVSANSVAIVIGDLRRSLDDSASDPVYISTVGKRGYRLSTVPEAAASAVPTQRRRVIPLLLFGVFTAAVSAAAGLYADQIPLELVVSATRNDTGQTSYNPLALSMTAVVMDSVARFPHVRVVASGGGTHFSLSRRVTLDERLVIWNGAPEIALTATDETSRAVIWSAFATRRSGNLARDAAIRLLSLRQRLAALPRRTRLL